MTIVGFILLWDAMKTEPEIEDVPVWLIFSPSIMIALVVALMGIMILLSFRIIKACVKVWKGKK